jgi:DNA-binding transcriptional LysR family regulator
VQSEARARLAVNDFDIVRAAARAGLGIAGIAAYQCAQDVREGRLRRVLPEWELPMIELHALYPSTRHLSAKVTAFLQLAEELLPGSLRESETAE